MAYSALQAAWPASVWWRSHSHQCFNSVLPNRTVCNGKVPTCPVQYGSPLYTCGYWVRLVQLRWWIVHLIWFTLKSPHSDSGCHIGPDPRSLKPTLKIMSPPRPVSSWLWWGSENEPWLQKRTKGTLGDTVNSFHLNYGNGGMDIYICQNSSDCALDMGTFLFVLYVSIYLNKVDFRTGKKRFSETGVLPLTCLSQACFLQSQFFPQQPKVITT